MAMEHSCATPLFNEIDSTPIPQELKENEEYHLRLCLCPLCKHGMEVFGAKRPVSWILICRVIIYSLMELHKGTIYFSLKDDIHGFVAEHWHIFGQLDQFKTTPTRWKKAFLDGLSHSPYFQSGTLTLKKPNFWKLRRKDCPWTKQKKCNIIEDDDEQNQTFLPQTSESSPMPDLGGAPTRDNAKEFLKISLEFTKQQLEKCGTVCGNLSSDPTLSQNMKTLIEQFNWIKSTIGVVSANVEVSL
ncbi:hypothetical protein EIN_411050 [Entamoeba invadens IP1]|uniref:Uncharacterized protein n=1 Tax=Entamoeba invadens IP1 TaxID=370355 RepID=A0A0A1U128_ENTIV|nr:hypothetical protein EIN_411050 [Entamoeba invadens IP1]ELP87752.1 hypothetical protein EIN_411050 [Entamoeba invadens IP1]|eukprot:XP_004254523.1 hypothetical protein EIN_411050 [Entamoeba invadens IP1]